MKLDRLIQKFIDGQSSAFDEIYAQTRKSVYFVALSVLGDAGLAEDVMQTTYLRVIKNIRSFTIGTNASAWIIKIAKNEALNLKKSRRRELSVDEHDNEHLFGAAHPYGYGELTDLAKKTLTQDEFTVLMLVTACGYKRREVGQMLDMPTPTVSWKYSNAIKKMRQALEEN